MPSTGALINEFRQNNVVQSQPGLRYTPNDEEMRILKECSRDSFWYRSLPFSVVSVAITQALVTRGILSASPKYGSVPKLAFACFCGYMAGKISYMKTCQERFMRLENSPLGEALRQRIGPPQQFSKDAQSELSDPDSPSFETTFKPADAPSTGSYSDVSPVQMDKTDDFSAPAKSYMEDEPKRKANLYEDLRLKNRENYEVMLTQRSETLLKSSHEKETKRATKEVKKNIYGDTWEE